MCEVTQYNGMASSAPNLADRMSKKSMGNSPIPSLRKWPINTMKHQCMSTRYIPLPDRHVNTNAQHSNRHPKPRIYLPRWPRPPLKGERIGGAANGCTHSLSGQPMPQKPATSPNELDTLVTTAIKLESLCSIGISHVRLGGTSWWADDPNGPGNQTDGSHGQVDEPRGSADALDVSYNAETAILGHGDGLGTYLRPGDTKCGVREMDGLGSQMDTLSGHSDMPSVKTDTLIPTIAPTIIRTTQKRGKPPNLPGQTANRTPHKSNGLRGHAHRSDAHLDMPSIGYDMEMAKDKVEIISMHPIQSKSPNPLTMSANGHTNKTDGSRIHPGMLNVCFGMHSKMETPADEAGTISMCTIESEQSNPLTMGEKWPANEMNSCGNWMNASSARTDTPSIRTDTLIPANTPETISIHPAEPKPPDSPSWRAGWAPDESNGCGNCMDRSSACRDSHSIGNNAKTAENMTEIIRTCPIKPKTQNSPITTKWTPEELNGDGDLVEAFNAHMGSHCARNEMETAADGVENIRTGPNDSKTWNSPKMPKNGTFRPPRQWRKVSQVQNIETAYLAHAHTVQPHESPPKRSYSIYRPSHQRGHIKSTPRNISQTQEHKTAHLQRVHFTQSCGNLLMHCWEVHRPRWQHGTLKIERLNDKNVSKAQMIKTAHLECTSTVQPHRKAPNRVHGVNRPNRQCGRPKIKQINISQAQNGEMTHLEHAYTVQPYGSPPKQSCRVFGPRCWCRQMKFIPRNISRAQEVESTHLEHHQPMHPSPPTWIWMHHLVNDASPPSRHKRQHGRPKIKRINISKPQMIETTYLWHVHIMQPHGNTSNRVHRVYTPSRQCGWIKFEPISVSKAQNGGNAYLVCTDTAQPHGSPLKCCHRVHRPKCWCGWLKMWSTNVSRRCKERNTYQGLYKPIQLLPRDPDDPAWSTSIGSLLNGLQSLKNNLQNVSSNNNKSIASDMHLRANRSTMCNAFIANTWLTKSGSVTAVSNLRNKTQTLEHGLHIYLESLSTHSFDI